MLVETIGGALYSFSPSPDFGSSYLGKGLEYVGIAIVLLLIWLLIHYKFR